MSELSRRAARKSSIATVAARSGRPAGIRCRTASVPAATSTLASCVWNTSACGVASGRRLHGSTKFPEPATTPFTTSGTSPILVVRVDEKTVKAYYNACPHRGTALARGRGRFRVAGSCAPSTAGAGISPARISSCWSGRNSATVSCATATWLSRRSRSPYLRASYSSTWIRTRSRSMISLRP